jgi:hypothetical protein
MKRITALVLTVILLVLLAATPTLAEGGTGEPATPPQAAAEGLRQEEGESTPTDAAVPESGEETSVSPIPEVPEDPAVREELGIADDPVVLTGWAKELADFRSEQGDVLPFGTLRERLEKSNYNVKNLKEQIADLSDISVGSINSAIGELRKLDSALSGALGGIQGMDPALAGTLGLLLQVNSTNIRSQISTLDGQIDSLKVSKRTGENSLKNGIDQIVKGTETLYIAIATMEANLGSIERGLQTLDRAIAIYEKQYELGMASLYDLESMRHQRDSAVSSLQGLLFQIRSSKITLEGMCGLPLTGTTRLEYLVIPSEEAVNGVDFDGEVRRAMGKNVDVMNARVQEDYDHSDANEYAVKAAEDSFTYNFKVICLTVGEKWRLTKAAQETLAFQRRTFEITAKKYDLGMVSEEEYLAGKNDVLQAESDLYNTQIELFSAYNNYTWARDYGIV